MAENNKGRYNQRNYKRQYNKRPRRQEPERQQVKKKREGYMAKKCPFCNSEMRFRGPSDAAGATSWKCKNKRCGRTTWVRKNPVPPEPIVPVSAMLQVGS
jgi:hypothetical protein